MEKVKFNSPVSQEIKEFFCLEQTKINNQNYLLVTEEEDGDSDAYILKETSSEDEETVYEISREIGFSDVKNFHYYFKKMFGVTPNEFRKNHREEKL